MPALYSIGYATKPLAVFLEQLRAFDIAAVADVRSVPYSKRFHDYHREPLAATLRRAGVHYVYLGEELGPRSPDPDHYDDEGQVQFERLARSSRFRSGAERLRRGLEKGLHIAMLCAEKDPAICHRSLLVAHHLQAEHDLDTTHILHDGSVESQQALARRLMETHGILPDLLRSEQECAEVAWRTQCCRCAYRRPPPYPGESGRP